MDTRFVSIRKWHFTWRCLRLFISKAMRWMGCHWLSFKETACFSEKFWSYWIRTQDHKAIEYMVKSKTETHTTRLKTLLLKLSEYTIDLKYQKGSEIHTSNALSRLCYLCSSCRWHGRHCKPVFMDVYQYYGNS